MRTLCLIFLAVQLSSASVIYTLTRSSDSITLLSLEFTTRDYILPPLINQPYTAAKDVPYRPAGALFISPANEKCAYRIVDYCSGPGTWLWRDNAAGLEVLVAGANGYELLTNFAAANTLEDGTYYGPYGSKAFMFSVHDPIDVPEPASLTLAALGCVGMSALLPGMPNVDSSNDGYPWHGNVCRPA